MRPEKKRHYRIFMFVTLLIGIVGGFVWFDNEIKNAEIVSPIHTNDVSAQTVTPTPEPSPPEPVILPEQSLPLAEKVAEVIGETTGTFGIAVKNLTTGESYYQQANESFVMASTYKVPLVLTSFIEQEKGTLSPDTMLGSFPLARGRELIITRSEESLAVLLSQKLTWNTVEKQAVALGMKNTDFTGDFTTTPQDMLTILEKIYKGQGMSTSVRDEMYDLLVRQEINDRLPKYLPDSVIVAHKTGELADVRHDIGIVTDGDLTYIIVLLSKELGVPEKGKEVEAQLSRMFYQHFTSD